MLSDGLSLAFGFTTGMLLYLLAYNLGAENFLSFILGVLFAAGLNILIKIEEKEDEC